MLDGSGVQPSPDSPVRRDRVTLAVAGRGPRRRRLELVGPFAIARERVAAGSSGPRTAEEEWRLDQMGRMVGAGVSVQIIAERFGVSRQRVEQLLARAEITGRRPSR